MLLLKQDTFKITIKTKIFKIITKSDETYPFSVEFLHLNLRVLKKQSIEQLKNGKLDSFLCCLAG